MSKILQAQGKGVAPKPPNPDEGDVEARAVNAMSKFARKLFAPLLLGALIMISTTFPLVVPIHVSLQTQWRDAMEAGDDLTASELSHQMSILGALREPWNFIGMGLVFFAIGRFFGTIIGFVQARMVILSEGASSLVSLGKKLPEGRGSGPES